MPHRLLVTTLGSWIYVQGDAWIWKVRPDGSNLVQVSPPGEPSAGPGFDAGLDWSADGEWLLACDSARITLTRVATGEVVPLRVRAQQRARMEP